MSRQRTAPGSERRSAELRAGFVAAYTGSSDPDDALFWLDHPDADGPSGAPSPASSLAGLRQSLYRRDVDESVMAAYREREQVVARDRTEALRALDVARRGAEGGIRTAVGRPRTARILRRTHSAPAALGAALLLAFTVSTIGIPVASDPVPLRFHGPASTAASQEAAISALFTTEFAATSGPTRSVVVVPPDALAVGDDPVVGRTFRVTGTRDVPLPTTGPRSGTARLTVLVVCSGPGDYEWTLRGDPDLPYASSPVRRRDCQRSATAATVDVPGSEDGLQLRFTGPSDASTFVALALTRSD